MEFTKVGNKSSNTDRSSSNASDIFSKYLNPLETKGEPSKSEKKRTLPPTLPRTQLSRIDEQVNSKENYDAGNIQTGHSGNPRAADGTENQTENIYDCPTTFNPRQFNANFDGTIKDPNHKGVADVRDGKEVGKFTNSSANGEATKHDLGITERNGNSIRNRTLPRISSIRDVVAIRRVIDTQESQNKDGTIDRYIYLDRGNTCCLRISFLICLIAIIVLFILVANNTSRLSTVEGECPL
jgi:hypothetical protein